VSFLKNALPVYSTGRELLYYAPFATVPRLIEDGRVRPLGSSRRGVRALVAMRGEEDSLRADRPPTGQRFSDNRESSDNPRGVWHFRLAKSFGYGT
jgi:hypothetical protein